MTQLSFASRKGSVRDTPYEVLDEDVLAAFRRPRVRLNGENVLVDKAAEHAHDVARLDTGNGGDRVGGEGFPQYRSVLEQLPLDGLEAVQPRGDQCVQALGNFEGVQRPVGAESAMLLDHEPAIEEHAHGLDGVEGDPGGALADARAQLRGETGNEPIEELTHRIRAQRVEVKR